MLRFEEVSFRNFLSFGNKLSTFKLDSTGTTLIVGRNLDNPNNVSSNGSGKTTILQAISYALYNKSLSGISKERLINRTNDKRDTLMEVILKFTVNADEYTVRRYRGESYGAQIIKNGEDITPDSVSNIDAKIEEIIGISYELFTKIIVFTGSATSFLELPVAHQRNLIEELFKITALTKKATKLKEQIKDTETEISVANAVINQQRIAKNNQERHIEQAMKRVQDWDADTAAEIAKLQADLEEASKIDFEKEQRAHARLAELLKEQTEHASAVRANTRELRAATAERDRRVELPGLLIDR
jgi:DNA repair exonuclease SbcCD ATPase subunit